MKKIIIIVILFILLVSPRAFSAPVLNFSDITSGPKIGNTDGLGSGVIVTIWGNNLGGTQGTSKVYVGDIESDHVYYWKNADGTLPGGPADLYTHHRMQEIAFSVPAGAADGSNGIKVIINSETSNILPFTIRSGGIYFIKSTGSDSGNGSWSSPWLTYDATMNGGAGSKLVAGDTVYSVGVDTTSGIRLGGSGTLEGTVTAPISLISYPNTSCDISGEGGDSAVVDNWYPEAYDTAYVNLSKLSVTAYGNVPGGSPNGIKTNPYNRIVGVEITGPTVYGGYGGAINCSGSAGNPPIGGAYLGIYIHDYGYRSTTPGLNNYSYTYSSNSNTWTDPPYDGVGDACTNCTSMDRYQHLYYLSIRQNSTIVDPYEIGWNNLVNNPILEGIHIYDQATSGSGFNGPIKVHNNWVENQGGASVDTSLPYDPEYAQIELYNNVIVVDSAAAWSGEAMAIAGNEHIKVWNNTIYGYKLVGLTTRGGSASGIDFRNNIFVDLDGLDYTGVTPGSYSNNLFYSAEGASLPAWYSSGNGDINANPLFTDATNKDFSLTSTSPAADAGYDASTLFDNDFINAPRDVSYDIGAFEYSSGAPLESTCYLDADSDGYSDGTSETGVETCSENYYEAGDLTATSGDCKDSDAAINPSATEICGNGVDEDCDGTAQACSVSANVKGVYSSGCIMR